MKLSPLIFTLSLLLSGLAYAGTNCDPNVCDNDSGRMTDTAPVDAYSVTPDYVDVTAYDLNFSLQSDMQTFLVHEKIFLNLNQSVDHLTLDANKQVIAIQNMTVNGKSVNFDQQPRYVTFPLPVLTSQTQEVDVVYTVRSYQASQGLFTQKDKYRNDAGFATELQYEGPLNLFVSDNHTRNRALYTSHYDLPRDWTVTSNGVLTQDQVSEGRHEMSYSLAAPIPGYLFSFVAGAYNKVKVPYRFDVEFWWPKQWEWPYSHQDNLKSDMNFLPIALQYMESRFGEYPFPRLSLDIAQANGLFANMEHTTNILMNSVDYERKDFSHPIMAHEMVHQWFGGITTAKDWSHLWLNEAFATYFEAMHLERTADRMSALDYRIRQRNAYWELDAKMDQGNIVQDHADASSLPYEKASFVISMLREQLGTKFYSVLRAYLTKFWMKAAATEDFVSVVEQQTGRSFKTFFSQWLYQPGFPKVDITVTAGAGQNLQITAKQNSNIVGSVFNIDLPVRVFGKDGSVQNLVLTIDGHGGSLNLPLTQAQIAGLEIDPNVTNLTQTTLTMPTWLWQANVAQNGLLPDHHAQAYVELNKLIALNCNQVLQALDQVKTSELAISDFLVGVSTSAICGSSSLPLAEKLFSLRRSQNYLNSEIMAEWNVLASMTELQSFFGAHVDQLKKALVADLTDAATTGDIMQIIEKNNLHQLLPDIKNTVPLAIQGSNYGLYSVDSLFASIVRMEKPAVSSFTMGFLSHYSTIVRGYAALGLAENPIPAHITAIGEAALFEMQVPHAGEEIFGETYVGLSHMVKALQKINDPQAKDYLAKIAALPNLPTAIATLLSPQNTAQPAIRHATAKWTGVRHVHK